MPYPINSAVAVRVGSEYGAVHRSSVREWFPWSWEEEERVMGMPWWFIAFLVVLAFFAGAGVKAFEDLWRRWRS
jgi:hypothetical protein